MADIGEYRYDSVSLETKYGWLQQGRGPEGAHDGAVALRKISESMKRTDENLRKNLGALGVAWQGRAAERAADALQCTADDAADAATFSETGAARTDDYGASFADLRNKVPAPIPEGENSFGGMLLDGFIAAQDWAGAHLEPERFIPPRTLIDVQSDYQRRVEANATADQAANAAFKAHEEATRHALQAIPEPPAPSAPTGTDGTPIPGGGPAAHSGPGPGGAAGPGLVGHGPGGSAGAVLGPGGAAPAGGSGSGAPGTQAPSGAPGTHAPSGSGAPPPSGPVAIPSVPSVPAGTEAAGTGSAAPSRPMPSLPGPSGPGAVPPAGPGPVPPPFGFPSMPRVGSIGAGSGDLAPFGRPGAAAEGALPTRGAPAGPGQPGITEPAGAGRAVGHGPVGGTPMGTAAPGGQGRTHRNQSYLPDDEPFRVEPDDVTPPVLGLADRDPW